VELTRYWPLMNLLNPWLQLNWFWHLESTYIYCEECNDFFDDHLGNTEFDLLHGHNRLDVMTISRQEFPPTVALIILWVPFVVFSPPKCQLIVILALFLLYSIWLWIVVVLTICSF
jgi:hypothetical protein